MDKLIVTIGLPGSGKTTWSKELAENNKNIKHIDVDFHMFKDYTYEDIEDKQERFENILKKEVSWDYGIEEVILDGLFLNTKDVIKILTTLSSLPDLLEIHFWNEDRENCLWNDKHRRDENSELTIKSAKLENINIEDIKDALVKHNDKMESIYGWREECYDFDIKIIEHDVEKKPEWKMFVDKYKIKLNKYNQITSESWKVGGSWWSYTGAEGDIEPEEQPSSFRELEDILDNISHINFTQRNRIISNCVSVESDTVNDYYSIEHINYFVCDIENLYDTLDTMGLIDLD